MRLGIKEIGKLFLAALLDAVESTPGPPGRSTAKRTCCCDVLMWDVWGHAPSCAQNDHEKAWRKANPNADILHHLDEVFSRPTPGDTKGVCPECGYPIGHYGIYTVGKECGYCGYLEKRA